MRERLDIKPTVGDTANGMPYGVLSLVLSILMIANMLVTPLVIAMTQKGPVLGPGEPIILGFLGALLLTPFFFVPWLIFLILSFTKKIQIKLSIASCVIVSLPVIAVLVMAIAAEISNALK